MRTGSSHGPSNSLLLYLGETIGVQPASTWQLALDFYLRPVLASGYCRCLRLSVCVSVRQSLACPRGISRPVQAWITKFGPKMQNTLTKVPNVLWSDRP